MPGIDAVTRLGLVIVAIYAVYVALTIGMQFGVPWIRTLQRYDPLVMIVRWSLFAPQPCMSDYHLVAQGVAADGVRSPWREWHSTRRRERRAMRNCADGVVARLGKDGARAAQLSPAYLAMLTAAIAVARAESWREVRFAIVATEGGNADTYPELVLASATHACS